jgi:hypothetical protein
LANDMLIIITIVVFFICMGMVLPYIKQEMGQQKDYEYSSDALTANIRADDVNTASAWNVLKSVLTMFVWTFGEINWIIDLCVFMPIRILLLLTVARNIRGVGA